MADLMTPQTDLKPGVWVNKQLKKKKSFTHACRTDHVTANYPSYTNTQKNIKNPANIKEKDVQKTPHFLPINRIPRSTLKIANARTPKHAKSHMPEKRRRNMNL